MMTLWKRSRRASKMGAQMPDWMIQLAGIVGACGAAYAAIKADLTRAIMAAESAHSKAEAAHGSADECHARLDRHIEVKH